MSHEFKACACGNDLLELRCEKLEDGYVASVVCVDGCKTRAYHYAPGEPVNAIRGVTELWNEMRRETDAQH